MRAANRVILNTCILYGNMVFNACFALLSTRWILEALGQSDFGIYNLVGGVIAMFSFLNVAMVAATQRFLSYSIGQNHQEIIKETFKCSVILHLVIGFIVLLIFELLGGYFMHYQLDIPSGRIDEAMVVLHCLSVTSFFTIITVPYQAVLNAHENMIVIALISMLESALKILIALTLLKYMGDRLILYAVLMMALMVSGLIINRVYCWKHYPEVRIKWRSKIDTSLFKKMFSFAGWNFIGSISSLLRNQGLAMMMNTFFGVIINAAYGIATQVNGQAQFFSRTIIRALQPQVVKSEGAGNRERMIRLALTTCKIPFLMLSIVVAPLIAEMPFILSIWLKSVPDNTVNFCSMFLLITLLMQVKMGLSIAIDSVGKIKWYQIVCGGLHFIVLPLAYFCYKLGLNPTWGMYVVFIEEFITVILTSLFARKISDIKLTDYYFKVFIPSVIAIIGTYYLTSAIVSPINNNWLHLISFTTIYAISISIISYTMILSPEEQNVFKSFTTSLLKKLKIK